MRLFHPCSWLLSLLFVLVLSSPGAAATLTLAWDAPQDDKVEGYIVLYGTKSGAYMAKLDVGNVTSIAVNGLATGTKYFFAVHAYDQRGLLSERSNEASGMTSTTSIPPGGGYAPGDVSAGFRNNRYLDLSWLPAAGAPTGYRVEVGTEFGETAYSALTPDHSIAFDMAELPAETYFVRIRALFGSRYGHRSEELVISPANAIPPADQVRSAAAGQCVAPPNAPRQFTATANGAAVVLNWQRGAGEAPGGYVLQAGSAPGLQDVLVAQFAASAVGVHAVAAPAAYALRLSAANTCGASQWAPETMLYVGVEPLPGAPPVLTQQVNGGLVSLAWEAPDSGGEVTRYLIEAATPVGPFVYDTAAPVTAFSNANTPPGQYLVTVRAGNATGFGPASRPVTVLVQ